MRKKEPGLSYKQLQEQAQAALRQIQKDIREHEKELTALRDQERRLDSMFDGTADSWGRSAGRGGHRTPAASGGRRTDWGAVLAKLPKQFKAADVRKAPGMSDKRYGDIFAGITRWIEAKQVKRKDRGTYERVS
jgi:hypothetical protein